MIKKWFSNISEKLKEYFFVIETPSDFERVMEYHEWLGDTIDVETDPKYKPEVIEYNKRITIGKAGEWFWIYYLFQDDKLVAHYIGE